MDNDVFIMSMDELVEGINNLNNTLKAMKEDLDYITAMMEDKEYYD